MLIGLTALVAAVMTQFTGVAHVIDGDTLRVGAERVRLSGIDAPELKQRCGIGVEQVPCGALAAEWLKSRIEGQRVDCVSSGRDRYERMIAICRIAGRDVGAALVDAGWATAYRRYSDAYAHNEAGARMARLGIWKTGFEAPSNYRHERRLAAGSAPPPDPRCSIKGNISAKGVKIYHLPGSRAYPEVRINVADGERWFCTESQASAAGWRPVR
jgi:endonuclease YncB( thermonuclease family)